MQEAFEPKTRLALLSRAGSVLEAYRSFFERAGVTTLHAPSVTKLFEQLPDLPISGIVTDLPVVVRASAHEKLLLEAVEGIFPNARVNWQPHAGFRVLFADAARSGEENLLEFVARSRQFTPRSLRKDARRERNLNVLMWRDGESPDQARRAFTKDISLGGIFASTCEPPPEGTELWVQLLELSPSPLKVKVRWERGWGRSMNIPGFGAEFVELTEAQIAALKHLLAKE